MAIFFPLEKFPAEVIDHILQYLPKASLANLRLTSSIFRECAKYYLFRQLTLSNSTASAAKARYIIKNCSLAGLVREFSFDASFRARVR